MALYEVEMNRQGMTREEKEAAYQELLKLRDTAPRVRMTSDEPLVQAAMDWIDSAERRELIEAVNHPDYYQGGCLEAIDVIEDFDLGFCLGNAVKYILRAGKKGNKVQDLDKAIWYLQREIQNVKDENGED